MAAAVSRLIDNLPNPNGVILSPDEKTLYVIPSGQADMMAYPISAPGKIGKGRVFSLLEVTSEPEPGEHERWSWIVGVRYLASVPLLSLSPTLDDIGVSPMSVRRQSHIRLSPEQGRRAEELITARNG